MADLGAIGFDIGFGAGRIHLLTVQTAGEPLPALTETVSGIVTDDSSAPAARTVRVYRRSDGMLIGETVSNATTGAYSVDCPTDEVQRIVLDDDAGTLYNDIIDRVIPG